jgi:hypothetical protein
MCFLDGDVADGGNSITSRPCEINGEMLGSGIGAGVHPA